MPVTMPISAAGSGPSPYSTALSAPVTQNTREPERVEDVTTRSSRPTVGWKAKVSRPAATGTIR